MCVELTHTERRCSTAKTMFEIIFFFWCFADWKKKNYLQEHTTYIRMQANKNSSSTEDCCFFFFFALLFKSFSFTLSFFVFLLSSFRFHYQIAGVFLFSSSSSYFSSIFNIMLFMFFVFVWCWCSPFCCRFASAKSRDGKRGIIQFLIVCYLVDVFWYIHFNSEPERNSWIADIYIKKKTKHILLGQMCNVWAYVRV